MEVKSQTGFCMYYNKYSSSLSLKYSN